MASNDAWRRRARLALPTPQANEHARLDVHRYLSRLPDAVVGPRYGDSLFHPAPGWWRYSLSPYLTAIADLNLKPTNVLDIGCGDGLVTCFYAHIYPDAEVIALDECKLCLITTRTIAARLGLNNLHIVQGDATNLGPLLPRRTFDLVFARALTAFRCSCGRSLGDPLNDMTQTDKMTQIVKTIRRILSSNNGMFISTENWSGPATLWCWALTVMSAGLVIDWTLSQGIPTAKRRWSMLVAQMAPASTGVSLTDILAFLIEVEAQHVGRGPPVTGYLAEALFNILVPDGFIFGFQATRYETILRRELYSARALLVSYDYTNGTERELRFWPRSVASQLASQLEDEATDLRNQGWAVLRFVPRGERSDDCQG